ncbi:MAG: hypothetical protein V3V20_12475 [Algisphaera sp.]
MPGPLLFIAFVIAALVAVAFRSRRGQPRAKALAQWAQQHNLSFAPHRDRSLTHRFPQFALFRQGRNAYAYNIVFGLFEGRQIYAFDHHHQTEHQVTIRQTDSNGRTRTHTETRITHHHFSAVVVEPELPLKPLLIRPEGLFDKVADFFGKGDLNFESAAFSRKYHVTAPDRRWAYDVLHARVIDFLLDQPRLVVEFTPRHILIMRPGEKRMDIDVFKAAVQTADQMLDLLPDYVRMDTAPP